MCFPVLITPLLVLPLVSIHCDLVTTPQGTINGTTLVARNGRIFNAYLNIPFAEPPARFQPPVEAKQWKGIRDGSVKPNSCVQKRGDTNETIGKEDCLYLNVYTPLNVKKGTNLPVLFYIFGGAFKVDGVDGPDYFMQHDIVYVIPNYRLGVLGFLSTGDTVISGNFALKDQNLALRWTQKNIRYFGGDPNKVTLHGHSSGAVNAHMHTLSPLSKGLFQQLILQSGSAYCPFSYFDKEVTRSLALELARVLNCNTNSSEEILRCFLRLDASAFVSAPESLYIWDKDPESIFRPSVEDENVEGAFLTEIPQKMQHQDTSLRWMIGLTTGEGAYKAATYLDVHTRGQRVKELNDHYKFLFPITLQYLWNTKAKYMDYISRILRSYYFHDKEISEDTAEQMTQLYTQGSFGFCVLDAIHQYPGPKYVYWYNYLSNYSTQNEFGYYPVILGTSCLIKIRDKAENGINHGDDIHLLFSSPNDAVRFSAKDVMFSDELVKRWTNFIQTGDPNRPSHINETIMSYWEPVTSKNIEYLKIEIDGTMGTGLYKNLYPFWKSLPMFSKYFN